jgi:WD40 repeat protein
MAPGQVEKCRQWLRNRWPVIGGWLRGQAIKKLARDGSPEAVRTLAGVVWRGEEAEARAEALEALRRLARQENHSAQEALCRFVTHHHQPSTEREVLAAGYRPREESQRALFYFLTEQWEEYEALDFDHGLLRTVYEAANEQLRRRIAATARRAGRLEWVGIASGGRQGRRLASMTDVEWKAALIVLEENDRWEEFWRLAQEAPPRWSAPMLCRLHRSGWTPENDGEDFDHLVRLAESWPEEQDFGSLMEGRAVLRGHRDEVRCLAFSPDGGLIASGSADRTVRLWNLPEGRPLQTLEGHRSAVNCLAISSNGRLLASGGKDSSAWLWRLPAAQTAVQLKGHSQMVLCLAITPDSRVLATGSADSAIQLWSLPDGKNLKMLEGHTASVQALAVSPDGDVLASAGEDCTVRLWSLPEGRHLRTLSGHRNADLDAVLCLAISPDGKLLASAGTDQTICLWSLPGGQEQATLQGHLGPVQCLAISPDGRTLASGGDDQTVRLWRLPEGRLLETWQAHSGEVTRLAVSPDGRLLASVSGGGRGHDHSVRLWNIPERKRVKTLDGHGRYVACVAISPDGRTLASGSGDGTVRLWTSELDRLSYLPVRQTTLKDLAWVQQALRQGGRPDPERQALAFLAALMRRRRRHDVEVDVAAPRVIEVGEFDVEIEG